MAHSNPYSRYAHQVDALAQTLLGNESLPIDVDPGSRVAFVATADYLHATSVEHLGETLPQIIRGDEVRHGMRVIARMAYHAALRAEELNMPSSDLTGHLIHPATFQQTLGPIASDDNEVSKRLERTFGLWGEAGFPPRYYYVFQDDGSISFGETSYLRDEIIAEKGLNPNPSAICGAHRAQALEPIYTSVMPLYATHAALGGAILSTPDKQAA